MKAVIQRVTSAAVQVDDKTIAKINTGLLVLLGIAKGDGPRDVSYLVDKIVNLRIFEDQNGKMNHSLTDIGGQLLVVSQFTLAASCRKGRRPSFAQASPPEAAQPLYQQFIDEARAKDIQVACGEFGAMMMVSLTNQGPVTFILESKGS